MATTERIFIRDLRVHCILGINPRERVESQDILINIQLDCHLGEACHSDRIEDTVDYKVLKDELLEFCSQSSFFLIEHLAECVAELCLKQERVQTVKVCIDKPGALTGARSVAVEVERCRAS